jgi:hypothetical protein
MHTMILLASILTPSGYNETPKKRRKHKHKRVSLCLDAKLGFLIVVSNSPFMIVL